MNKTSFSQEEAAAIRRMLMELRTSDRIRQKRIRDDLRKLGFFISDFSHGGAGFTRADFDILVQRGTIRLLD